MAAREVGALVAVKRGVADVDWIQQVQSCISVALVRSAAQAEPTVTSGRANDDGDERQLADGRANAASGRSDARLADAVSTILSTMDCKEVEHAAACGVGSGGAATVAVADQAREEAAGGQTKEEQTWQRTKSNSLARARWAGLRRTMVQSGVNNWVRAVG